MRASTSRYDWVFLSQWIQPNYDASRTEKLQLSFHNV